MEGKLGFKRLLNIKFIGVFIIACIINVSLYIVFCNSEISYEELKNSEEYNEYIAEKIDNIDTHIKTSLVEQESESYYRLLKTKYDLSNLRKVEIKKIETKSFNEFSTFNIDDMISIFIVVFFVFFLGRPEDDFLDLIDTTKHSKKRYNIYNILSILLLVIITVTVNFVLPIIVSNIKNGDFNTLNYAVQNSNIWKLSALLVNIKEAYLYILSTEILKLFCIGLLSYYFINIFKSRSFRMLMFAVFLLVESSIMAIKSSAKIITILKTINIFQSVKNLFSTYNLIGIGKYWISFFEFYLFVVFLLTLVLMLMGITIKFNNTFSFSRFIERVHLKNNYHLLELKKIIISQNVLSFLLMIIVVMVSLKLTTGYSITEQDIQIKQYYNAVNGDYEDKTLSYIDNIDGYIEMYRDISTRVGDSSIFSGKIYEYEKIKEEILAIRDRLVELSNKGIKNVQVLDEIKFNNLLNKNGRNYMISMVFIMLLVVVFVSTGTHSFEKKNEVTYLIRSTVKGKTFFLARIYAIKLVIIFITLVMINMFCYENIKYSYVLKPYELNASIQSITMFECFEHDITIKEMFFILILIRVCLGILVSTILISISFIYSDMSAYLVSIVICFGIYRYFLGIDLFSLKIPIIELSVIMIALLAISVILVRRAIKKWTID
jgi:hypothetical protein